MPRRYQGPFAHASVVIRQALPRRPSAQQPTARRAYPRSPQPALGGQIGDSSGADIGCRTSLGRGPAESAAVSGMAFFVGYLLAALGPVAAGALRDATGGYRVPFLALAGVGLGTLLAGVAAARVRRPGTP